MPKRSEIKKKHVWRIPPLLTEEKKSKLNSPFRIRYLSRNWREGRSDRSGTGKRMLCIQLLLIGMATVYGLERETREELPDTQMMRSLRRETRITKNSCMCNRDIEICSCCGRIDQASSDFHSRGCGIVHYGRRTSRSMEYEVSINNRTVDKIQVPETKSPVELCVPAAFLMICTKFFNVDFHNATFTFCFRFDVKYSRFTIFSVDFDCVRVSLAPGIDSKARFFNSAPANNFVYNSFSFSRNKNV